MADFCNVCADKMFGKEVKPEIDVLKIFNKLKEGFYQPVLCEGCALNAIMKKDGKMKIHFLDEEPDIWYDYDEDIIFKRFTDGIK